MASCEASELAEGLVSAKQRSTDSDFQFWSACWAGAGGWGGSLTGRPKGCCMTP